MRGRIGGMCGVVNLAIRSLLFGLVISGCDQQGQSQQPAGTQGPSREITENPMILGTPSVSADDMTFRGARLGDPESKIPAAVQAELNSRQMGDQYGNGWNISNGRVMSVLIRPKSLEALKITSRDAIERQLGTADRVTEEGRPATLLQSAIVDEWRYHYDARNFTVGWSATSGFEGVWWGLKD